MSMNNNAPTEEKVDYSIIRNYLVRMATELSDERIEMDKGSPDRADRFFLWGQMDALEKIFKILDEIEGVG